MADEWMGIGDFGDSGDFCEVGSIRFSLGNVNLHPDFNSLKTYYEEYNERCQTKRYHSDNRGYWGLG
jgi:hypothetical protein